MNETLDKYKEFVKKRLEPISDILAIIAAGDFSRKLEIPPENDEFAELYVGLDFMMEDLHEHKKKRDKAEFELKKHQQHLEELVKQRTEELLNINEKLKQEIDIREKTEKEMTKSEERAKFFFDHMSDVIFTVNSDFILTDVTPSAERFSGYKPEELIGKSFQELELLAPESLQDTFKNLKQLMSGETPSFTKYIFITKDGEKKIAEVLSTPVFKDGKFIQLVSVARDVTERMRAEEALRESEEKYRNLVENITDVIYIIGKNGKITYVSPVVESVIGYTPEEIIGQYIKKFIYSEDLDRIMDNVKKILTGEKTENEYRILTKSGDIRWIHTSSQPITRNGEIIGLQGALSDITERKHAEEAIRESEELYKSLVKTSPEAVTATDLEGNIIFASPQTVKIYGYDNVEELLGKNAFMYIAKEDQERAIINLKKTLSEGIIKNKEYKMLKKDGSSFIGELSAALIKDVQGNPKSFIATVRDITDRKKAEENLKKALEEKDVLLREVHHRVKNNIQVITSMLNLHTKFIKDENYSVMIQEIQQRIRSMALIHEKLYKSEDISLVNFKEYIKELVNELFRSYGANVSQIRPKISAHDVSLGLDLGIPCGLIINELVSNSLKHGFPNGRGGEIEIGLDVDGDNKILLSVRDNGIGFPSELDFKNPRTFGLQLVNTLVAQLSGNIDLNIGAEKGTEINITFIELRP